MAANLSDMETSIADQLYSLYELKGDLANNINLLTGNDNAKQTDSFESLVDKVKDLDPTDTLDTLNISENGTYTANSGEYAGTLGWKTVSVHVTDTSAQGGNSGPGSYGGSSYGAGGSYGDADMVPTFTVTFHKYPEGTSYADDETAEVECEIYTDVTSIPISPRYCPEDQEDEQTAKYVFVKWNPEPINVQQNMDCYPLYEEANAEITDNWATIVANGGAPYRIGQWKQITMSAFKVPVHTQLNRYSAWTTGEIEMFPTGGKLIAYKVADASKSPGGASSTWAITLGLSFGGGGASNFWWHGLLENAGAGYNYANVIQAGTNPWNAISHNSGVITDDNYKNNLCWDNSALKGFLNSYLIKGLPQVLADALVSVSLEIVNHRNKVEYATETSGGNKIWLPQMGMVLNSTRNPGEYASYGAGRFFPWVEALAAYEPGYNLTMECADCASGRFGQAARVTRDHPEDSLGYGEKMLALNYGSGPKHVFFCL